MNGDDINTLIEKIIWGLLTDKKSGEFIGYATIGNLDSDDQEIGL